MQIHPLFSVKKAAEVLGVEKQFLREQLENGAIRGEKRRVGERDKWFIYHGEVKDLRDTKRLHELKERTKRISTEGLKEFFDEDDITDVPTNSEQPTGSGIWATADLNSALLAAPESANSEKAELLGDSTSDLSIPENRAINGTIHLADAVTTAVFENIELSDAVFHNETTTHSATLGAIMNVDASLVSSPESQNPDENYYVEPEPTNQGMTGRTSVTLDEVLQKLTVEFAYRLAEERSRVCELEQLLEAKEESLRRLPDLEKLLEDEQQKLSAEKTKLELEQAQRRTHEEQVVALQRRIDELESEKANQKPWWRRIFG